MASEKYQAICSLCSMVIESIWICLAEKTLESTGWDLFGCKYHKLKLKLKEERILVFLGTWNADWQWASGTTKTKGPINFRIFVLCFCFIDEKCFSTISVCTAEQKYHQHPNYYLVLRYICNIDPDSEFPERLASSSWISGWLLVQLVGPRERIRVGLFWVSYQFWEQRNMWVGGVALCRRRRF